MMDASRSNLTPNPTPQVNQTPQTLATKQVRKDSHDSNLNRIEAGKAQPNAKTVTAYSKHYARLAFLGPHLATLPDKTLHQHALDLAATVLSAAIEREHRKSTVTNLLSGPDKIPSSARFDFSLKVSTQTETTDEFKALKTENEIQLTLEPLWLI